jgi:hypothetical protein
MRNATYVFLVLLATLAHALAQAPGALVAPATGSALVGALAPDGTAQGTLVAGTDGVAFHTYWVEVPAGVARWTLTLDADADLDLALKFGSEIGSYDDRDRGGDWDYRDWDTGNPTVIVVEAPQAGRWYVDVFNALQVGAQGSYRLTLTVGGGQAVPPSTGGLPKKGGIAPTPPAPAAPAVVRATSTGAEVVGDLPIEGVGEGTLVAGTDGVAFHTYWVEVPAGVARWTLTLDADADLDLALKFGSEIGSYDDRDRGGDWDYRDWDTGNPTVIVVEQPAAGRWYVDVFNALQVGARGSYRLTSTVGTLGGVVPRPMPSPPLAGGASGFAGNFRLVGGDVVLDLQQDAAGKLAGTLSGSGVTMTVEGVSDAEGTYGIIYDDEGGMFFMAELVASGLRLTLYDADANGDPVESSARALDFERVGTTPGSPPANPLAPPGGALPPPPTTQTTAPPESGAVIDLRAGAQLAAGDRMRNAYVGASLVVPPGWQAWVADEPLLPLYVASQTQPGMAVVLTTHGVSLAQFERVLSEAIEFEEGAVLRLLGPAVVQGDEVSVRYVADGGVGVGLARSARGPGVIMLYVGGVGQEAVGASLLAALAASARFEAAAATADLQRAQQDWAGYRMWTYHYGSGGGAGDSGLGGRWSGEFEAHWDLCADGRFLHDGRTEQGTFAATGTAGGLASGTQFFGGVDTDSWSGRGRWSFAAIGDRIVLLLFDDAGSWSYYELGRASDGSVTLDGMPIERRAAGGC